MTPHVAQKKHSAIDGRTTRYAGYAVSINKRKLVDEIFGWSKTIGGLCKARFVGLAKVRTDHVHIRRLQLDTHGDHLWLAFVGDSGITPSRVGGKY